MVESLNRTLRVLLLALLVLGLWAHPDPVRLSAPAAVAAPAPPPPLLRPVEGDAGRAFDAPQQKWGRGHRGVNLAARPGEAVLASADGTVAFAGRVVDREVISLTHAGGYRTTHQPVHATVTVGQRVRAGDVIGYVMAGTECPDGCLHWGLKLGEQYLDPMRYLATTGVRLLPEGARVAKAPPPATGALLQTLTSPPLPQASGRLVRPTSGPVTSPFGQRFHPVLHVWKLHDGMDFGAPCGTPVRSAAAGRVVLTEFNTAYGNRVIVEHGSIGGTSVRTSYNHLSSFAVSAGTTVGQGQAVGQVGSTGYSTGCHLHFMVWANGGVTNPAGWVG